MKNLNSIFALLFVCTLLLSCSDSTITEKEEKNSVLRHMVFFKFKDSASVEAVNASHAAFLALPEHITEIQDFEWGLNNSQENLHQGLTHCYMLTFNSEEDRGIYLPHPKHQEFVSQLGPILDKVVVLDYWTN